MRRLRWSNCLQRAVENCAAFTLVELLVVIGIIALLISILMPAISRVRQSAQQIACSSNLRQLGQSVFMYASDYKGSFPPIMTSYDNYGVGAPVHFVYPGVYGALQEYGVDATSPVKVCPTVNSVFAGASVPVTVSRQDPLKLFSYRYNQVLGGMLGVDKPTSGPQPDVVQGGTFYHSVPLKLTDCTANSSYIGVFCDSFQIRYTESVAQSDVYGGYRWTVNTNNQAQPTCKTATITVNGLKHQSIHDFGIVHYLKVNSDGSQWGSSNVLYADGSVRSVDPRGAGRRCERSGSKLAGAICDHAVRLRPDPGKEAGNRRLGEARATKAVRRDNQGGLP